MHFSDRPLAVRQVIAGADLVVCGGTHNILCAALLAGKPVLAIPYVLEQFLHSSRMQMLGAGLVVQPGQESRIGGMLTRLLAERSFTQAAARFASRYASRPQDWTLTEIAERCVRLA
jgi:UDP:flavonoid glycosyltransferase YjiC (YdhE family)